MTDRITPPEFTGERMIPEGANICTYWEHIYRYRFAARFARGKDILDIACGEGYGAAALNKCGAKSLIGVDLDESTCDYARRKYGIDARQGDASSLSFPNNSFDLIVSYETIEHVPEPFRFLDECVRVLRPKGVCLISTPNVTVYNPDKNPNHNPYHCSEMNENEFTSTISSRFRRHVLYSQCPTTARFWSFQALRIPRTPWVKVNGIWSMQQSCRVFQKDEEQACRLDPVGEILRPESVLQRMVNPYLVTRRSNWSRETPIYFVCVARKPKKK
jgi:ubiquinone/menaquinone biosynthesis C-methylase UbiE